MSCFSEVNYTCLIMLLLIFEILPNQNLQARLVSIPFMLLEKKIEI